MRENLGPTELTEKPSEETETRDQAWERVGWSTPEEQKAGSRCHREYHGGGSCRLREPGKRSPGRGKRPGNIETQRPGKHTATNRDRRNGGTTNRPKRERPGAGPQGRKQSTNPTTGNWEDNDRKPGRRQRREPGRATNAPDKPEERTGRASSEAKELDPTRKVGKSDRKITGKKLSDTNR